VPITGVYEALAAADLHPDWVAGISIGAITVMGPLIAGNAPKTRVDKLHPFWEGITAERGGTGASGRIPCTRATAHSGGSIKFNAGLALVAGAPGFFTPRLPPPWLNPHTSIDTLPQQTLAIAV
jgi:NTE family protein